MGFEAGIVGQTPPGWFIPMEGWTGELTEEKADTGTRSVKLFKSGRSEAPFGNIMQSIPPDGLNGRRVVLQARILVVGSGRAQMWLRVDRRNGSMGAFDNMDNRPIFAGGWTNARIEADIEPDVESVNFGFMSLGEATLFIDGAKMQILGKATFQEPSPGRAITPRRLENLIAASKLLSYVRFFHPSDQAVQMKSWDHFAVALMERAEPAAGAVELAERLRESFAEIAPTVEIWAGTAGQTPPLPPVPSEARIVRWKHEGAGSAGESLAYQLYNSKVESSPLPASADPGICYFVRELGGGVFCRVPLAVFTDESGTLPRAPERVFPGDAGPPVAEKNASLRLIAANRSTRLAAVALAWGVFQHFYPYFDVVDTDWEAALPAALSKAAVDPDESAFGFTLREMVAKLHDGHGVVIHSALGGKSYFPLAVQWTGEEWVVTGRHATVPEKIALGDVLVSVDDRSLKRCYQEDSKWISAATEGWRRHKFEQYLAVEMPTENPVRIAVKKPDGTFVRAQVARVDEIVENSVNDKRPGNGAEVAPGILYFNLDGAEAETLMKLMPQLSAAKGVIFDLRGYPGSAGVVLMQHLIDKPATSPRWCVPVIRFPDREQMEWLETGRWNLFPQKPHLSGRIAFLTDGQTISYAESVMGIVEHYRLGEIVGSTTAGTNGNINTILLPGGYKVIWTGMKVLKHDGARHHGVGIAPTVPMMPTAQGIAQGRDEVLEKAIEVLTTKIQRP